MKAYLSGLGLSVLVVILYMAIWNVLRRDVAVQQVPVVVQPATPPAWKIELHRGKIIETYYGTKLEWDNDPYLRIKDDKGTDQTIIYDNGKIVATRLTPEQAKELEKIKLK